MSGNLVATQPGAVGSSQQWNRATALLAGSAILVAGFDLRIRFSVSAALILAVALSPVWISEIRRYWGARLILSLVPICLIWGLVLSALATDRAFDPDLALKVTGLVLSGIAVLMLILWGRAHLPNHVVVGLFGVGGVLGAFAQGHTNWKFDLALPVTFVVLGLVERPGRRYGPAAAVLAIGVFSAFNEGRSLFGFCAVAALLTLWQARPGAAQRVRVWKMLLAIAAVSVGIYLGASQLLSQGAFGTELQTRTNQQTEVTGNLILGGRPEWAATVGLVSNRPQGYGLGITSDWRDLVEAREGFAAIRFEPGGYASHYMFAEGFALHSVIADLWISFGFAGVALAMAMVVVILNGVLKRLAISEAPTSVLFAASLALWYLLFGPIFTDWTNVCAAVGLVAIQIPRRSEST